MPLIDDYTLTVKQHGVGGYTGGLIAMAAPINVWGAGNDDGTSLALPIGFSFDAFGTVFTDVVANTNGWLVFGTTSAGLGSGYDNSGATWGANGTSNPYKMALPWWDDLKTSLNGGYGQYETQGVAPNQTFIFEWSCQCYYNQSAGDQDKITFQVVLREGSNNIEYRYGPLVTYGVPARGSYSASCGARVNTTGAVPSNVRDFLGAGYAKGGSNTVIGTSAVAINAGPTVIQYPGDPGNTDQGFAYDFLFSTGVVSSITPNIGGIGGGTPVTIAGAAFTGATGVDIGGNPATGVVVVGPTSITCTTPAGAPGAVDVDVITPGGTLTGTNLFVYGPPLPPPNPTSITPTSGPTPGGTLVAALGTDFLDGASFTLDGAPATSVVFVSSARLEGRTPPGAMGLVDLVVTNPTIQSGTLPGAFTYTLSPPTITSLSRYDSYELGGIPVTIFGTNFTPTSTVSFGLAGAGVGVVYVGPTQLQCTTPPYSPPGLTGLVDLTVTNAAGTSPVQLFTYVNRATITSPAPAAGPTTGGQTIVITGTNFGPATFINMVHPTTWVAYSCTPYPQAATSPTSITVVTPAVPAPAVFRMVVTRDGWDFYSSPIYTYTAPPPSTGKSHMHCSLGITTRLP